MELKVQQKNVKNLKVFDHCCQILIKIDDFFKFLN